MLELVKKRPPGPHPAILSDLARFSNFCCGLSSSCECSAAATEIDVDEGEDGMLAGMTTSLLSNPSGTGTKASRSTAARTPRLRAVFQALYPGGMVS